MTLLSMRNTVFVFALNLKMPLVRKEYNGTIKLVLVEKNDLNISYMLYFFSVLVKYPKKQQILKIIFFYFVQDQNSFLRFLV
jgi:hypothetical protein